MKIFQACPHATFAYTRIIAIYPITIARKKTGQKRTKSGQSLENVQTILFQYEGEIKTFPDGIIW